MATKRKRQEVKGGFPTAWEKSLDRKLNEGDVLEGFYRGHDDITTGGRTFRSYRIQPEGAPDNPSDWIGVAGGVLKNTIERVPEGTYVWITYLGMLKTEQGEAKNFKLECEEGVKVPGASDGNMDFHQGPNIS